MILSIHHTAISVPDLDKALEFYCGVLGFTTEWRLGWDVGNEGADRIVALRDSASEQAMIALGGTRLEIFQWKNPKPKAQGSDRPVCDEGFTHICLNVTDVWGEYERLAAAGVRFHYEPQKLGGGKASYAYGRDPFGNVIEIHDELAQAQPVAVSA